MKVAVLILFALLTFWELFMDYLNYTSVENPVPLNVLDVYDRKTYKKWQAYHKDRVRLSVGQTVVSFVITYLLLRYDLYAAVAPGTGIYLPSFVVVLFDSIIGGIAGVIFSYVGLTIEERYGFNKTTMDTFVKDQIKEFAIGFVLTLCLVFLFAALHQAMGDWILVLLACILLVFVLFVSFLYPYLSRIFNRFTPLEEGELRTKLSSLLEKHGYKVRNIMVMDASRRTTKSNAYFTGFGKTKTIVLYDTLLNTLTADEICAVFAHELGHGLHKDTLRNQLINLGNIVVMVLLLWLNVHFAGACKPFGFEETNYAFVSILVSVVYMPVFSTVYSLVTNGFSRKAEFRADRQAVEEGYADELVSALKKISRDDFACLSPNPLYVRLTYSHPTLSQRITAIEKLKKVTGEKDETDSDA